MARWASHIRATAERNGWYLWEAIPDGFFVEHPSQDLDALLTAAEQIGIRVLYLNEMRDEDGGLEGVETAFAVAGIQHRWSAHMEVADNDASGRSGDSSEAQRAQWQVTYQGSAPHQRGEYEYWDRVTGVRAQLADEHRRMVDEIVAHPEFSGSWHDPILRAFTRGLSDVTVVEAIRSVATTRFIELVQPSLEEAADQVASTVREMPPYSPLMHDMDVAKLIAASVPDDADPRVSGLAARVLRQWAWGSGALERSRSELEERASVAVNGLTQAEIDRAVFTMLKPQFRTLLASLLNEVPETLTTVFEGAIRKVLTEGHRVGVENRHATAARLLLARAGSTKAGTARTLGISPSVLGRLLVDYPDDVELGEDDPLREVIPLI